MSKDLLICVARASCHGLDLRSVGVGGDFVDFFVGDSRWFSLGMTGGGDIRLCAMSSNDVLILGRFSVSDPDLIAKVNATIKERM